MVGTRFVEGGAFGNRSATEKLMYVFIFVINKCPGKVRAHWPQLLLNLFSAVQDVSSDVVNV